MNKAHLANLGKLYQDIVHNTLFFEILNELPHGLGLVLAEASRLVEKHGSAMAFLLAIMVSLLPKLVARPLKWPWDPVGKQARKQKKSVQKRDDKGRFAKSNPKEP